MDTITAIKERRSIRKFTDAKVSRELLDEILDAANFSPTWGHFQIVRYTVLENRNLLDRLIQEGFTGFRNNSRIVERAAGVIIVSHIKGLSGHIPGKELSIPRSETEWEMFDAGCATQTLCLAAYARGIGTVIMGVFDEKKSAEIIKLPQDEELAAIVAYGYEEKHPVSPARKPLQDVVRYI